MNNRLEVLKISAYHAKSLLTMLMNDNISTMLLNDYYLSMRRHMKKAFGESLFFNPQLVFDLIAEDHVQQEAKEHVDLINLATFAFNVYTGSELQTCINSYFIYVVPFTKYTKAEVEFYFALKLALFRQTLSNSSDAINECKGLVAEGFSDQNMYLNSKADQTEDIIETNGILRETLLALTETEIVENPFVSLEELDGGLIEYVKFRITGESREEEKPEEEKPEEEPAAENPNVKHVNLEETEEPVYENDSFESFGGYSPQYEEPNEEVNENDADERASTFENRQSSAHRRPSRSPSSTSHREPSARPRSTSSPSSGNGTPDIPPRPTTPNGYVRTANNTFIKIPKTRAGRVAWTDEEVAFLERKLSEYQTTCWAIIVQEENSLLSNKTGMQLKDKAVNEIKRRKKFNLPLGGFEVVERLRGSRART